VENNGIIKYEGGLIKQVNNAISITNKLLASSERQKIIDLFIFHPVFFKKRIAAIYPLSDHLIEKYKDHWDWWSIGVNINININEEFINKYKEKLQWKYLGSLGRQKKIKWSEEFIDRY
jgi:hypothetical protein